MKASRELDAIVAEKVMQRKRAHKINECEDGYYSYCELCGHENSSWDLSETECTGDPYYSTSIEDAWEVVERLGGNMFQLHFDTRYGLEGRKGWSIVLDGIVMNQFIDTAPHAICLAACKAVGYDPTKEKL